MKRSVRVSAIVTTPSGQKHYPKIDDNKNGTVTLRYQPTEVGLHTLDVLYNQTPIQGSPFKFYVDKISPGYVTAFGPGLSHAIAGQPATFTIVTKDAGAGESQDVDMYVQDVDLRISGAGVSQDLMCTNVDSTVTATNTTFTRYINEGVFSYKLMW